jgi:D-alanyl-lipoteichoic acid acyltransferase DltB (MBOAT superfamily)
LASLFFYYKTAGFFFLLLLFTAIWDFFIGKKIHNARTPFSKKIWLSTSIAMNIGVLIYFKYAYFFTDIYNAAWGTHQGVFNHLAWWSNSFFGTNLDVTKIILPVGISFFTFQSISYTIEVYRGVLQPVKRFTDFAFFVTFFPQLVAGPIVRAKEFIPQIYQPYQLSRSDFGLAVFWILNGLIKKIFLSDWIATNFIDRVFANPESFSGVENLFALYGYSVQVYADFSGYTDMATGIALLMGFHLTKNFNSPYKANSLTEFWRRWHMSLSHWLRDYLYIPLGGNRASSIGSWFLLGLFVAIPAIMAQSFFLLAVLCILLAIIVGICAISKAFAKRIITDLNLMLTMLVGGLWHGASWNFLIWGGLNGAGLVFGKYWKKISPWEKYQSKLMVRAWTIFLTFSFITFTRVWFRSGSTSSWSELNQGHRISNEFNAATLMLRKIFLEMNWSVLPDFVIAYWHILLVILIGLVIHWLPEKWKSTYRRRFALLPYPVLTLAIIGTIFFVYQVISSDLQPFIYFQF